MNDANELVADSLLRDADKVLRREGIRWIPRCDLEVCHEYDNETDICGHERRARKALDRYLRTEGPRANEEERHG